MSFGREEEYEKNYIKCKFNEIFVIIELFYYLINDI